MGGPQGPVAAGSDGVEGEGEFGEEGQDVGHHERPAGLPRGGHHGVGLFHRQGDWFLDQDRLAGLQGLDGQPTVKIVGDAEINQVDLRVGQHRGEVVVERQAGQVHLRAARAEIPLDARPIPGQLLRVSAAQRDDLGALHPARRGNGSSP